MQVEQDMVGSLAGTLHRMLHGGAPESSFESLPGERQAPYRAAVEVLISELSGHVAALVKSIGEVAAMHERRAKQAHADHMQAISDKCHVEDLLREALPFIQAAKWRTEPGAHRLLERAQKALVEGGMELDEGGL